MTGALRMQVLEGRAASQSAFQHSTGPLPSSSNTGETELGQIGGVTWEAVSGPLANIQEYYLPEGSRLCGKIETPELGLWKFYKLFPISHKKKQLWK